MLNRNVERMFDMSGPALGSAYAGAIHDATLLLSRGTPVHERVGGTVTTMQKRKRPNPVDNSVSAVITR
jgi:hypothetical protein